MKDLLPKIDSEDGEFHDGNPATGTQGTRVKAVWLNNVQDRLRDIGAEIGNVIKSAKITLNGSKTTQLYEAIVAIINANRNRASTTKVGEVQLNSETDNDSETEAATPKVIKLLKGLIDSNARNLNNYIPNSKKSNAVDSTSSDSVATSNAVKTAYDKAVSAQSSATAANNNANNRIHNDKKSNSVTSTSNDTVATSGAVKTAYDKAVAADNNANGRIPNSKKSNSVSSTSSDTIATSQAVKTAYDRGTSALNVANSKANALHTHKHSQIADFQQGVLRYLVQGFTQNLNETGWTKLPNGLILQWGKAKHEAITTFPIAFPNRCVAINLCQIMNVYSYDAAIYNYSNTNFKAYIQRGSALYTAIGY